MRNNTIYRGALLSTALLLAAQPLTLQASGALHLLHGSFELAEGQSVSLPHDGGYLILQLRAELSPEWRQTLDLHGVELLEYIPDNAWIAHIAHNHVSEIVALDFVAAAGALNTEYKLPLSLQQHGLSNSALLGEIATVEVTFHSNVDIDAANAALIQLHAVPYQSEFLSGQRLLVALMAADLQRLAELSVVRWIEEPPAVVMDQNAEAAALAGIDKVRARHSDLTGSGIKVGTWEGGNPQASHPDLQDRVTIAQTAAVSHHATHVAGTIAGSGANNVSAQGMAPAAQIVSFDYYGDIAGEMRQAVQNYGIDLSNHSWGFVNGWSENHFGNGKWSWFGAANETRDANFGRYTTTSQQWDNFVFDTGLPVIKSAGNNRNDHGDSTHSGHYHGTDQTTLHHDHHDSDGNYDSLDMIAAAKNVITVGSVDDAGVMTNYSGWGPTDDDRVKPDIVANGHGVYSTINGSGYGYMTGTSMATPVVSGAAALIMQRYQQLYQTKPNAATVKAILLHTARDAGNPGPDYSYGWGLLDADAAIDLLDDDAGKQTLITHGQVRTATDSRYSINIAASTDHLKFTLVWNDIGASPSAKKALVNDLDLQLIAPNGTIYHPYTLGGRNNPGATARQDQANRVDNVEQVVVSNPAQGEWTIVIKAHSVQEQQDYSLASNLRFDGQARSIQTSNSNSVTESSGGGGGGATGLFMLALLVLPRLLRRK